MRISELSTASKCIGVDTPDLAMSAEDVGNATI